MFRVLLQPVRAPPPRVHLLAQPVDAPLILPALGPVHWRALLRLTHVRRVSVSAPEMGAGIAQLEARAELEAMPELHPALIIQAVGVLDNVPDEGRVEGGGLVGGAEGVGVRAFPGVGVEVVLAG